MLPLPQDRIELSRKTLTRVISPTLATYLEDVTTHHCPKTNYTLEDSPERFHGFNIRTTRQEENLGLGSVN
jgi:hypothetical protein